MKLVDIEPMKYKSFAHMNCSLAQTLDIIGERWTLLILRDAFFGVKRFGHFQRRLDIARNILTTRLNQLVDEGILEKRDSEEGAHSEYVLTSKGLDLQPVLLAMTHWGDKHQPNPKGDRLIFVERATGEPIQRMSVMSRDGRPLASRDITSIAGPALADGE
ncbi:MAG: helix-turn-helix domain-containing protein [Pseudomonadales bacterium]